MDTHIVYTTPAFSRSKTEIFETAADPRFSLKPTGLHFSVNGPKRRLLKMMAWQPTFSLRILDDCVNNNILLVIEPIDM